MAINWKIEIFNGFDTGFFQEPPFIQWADVKNDAELQACRSKIDLIDNLSGTKTTKCAEGYCIDLLNKLADEMGFSYQLHLVPDGQYGILTENGWTGLVKELLTDADGNSVRETKKIKKLNGGEVFYLKIFESILRWHF